VQGTLVSASCTRLGRDQWTGLVIFG